MITQSKNI